MKIDGSQLEATRIDRAVGMEASHKLNDVGTVSRGHVTRSLYQALISPESRAAFPAPLRSPAHASVKMEGREPHSLSLKVLR